MIFDGKLFQSLIVLGKKRYLYSSHDVCTGISFIGSESFGVKRWVHLDNRSVIESVYTHFALGCINIYIYIYIYIYIFDASTRRRL